ncbi:hypothetical protein KFE25_001883 [Diacronema lutheri]|uniref:RBR-type E3 ubiquitin transferase n=1 Tax=Diacronema lutheri TaxID=2081491 RepID=A0A8J5XPY1_DIALT|nr:hypothetical protein KFE25_001883 [Diacronema lutheri]
MADDESEMLFDNSCDDASDAEEDDDDYSEFEQPSLAQAPRPFRCLRPDDLREMQAAAVKRVAETLCCEPSDATVLLRSFKWDAERVISSYFENPEGVLEKAGVCGSSNRAVIDAAAAQPYQCPICLEMVTAFSALGCGHRACTPCYSAYVGHKIDDEGTAAVRARCPLVKCRVQLTDALVNALATDAQRARYAVYLERAFVDDHPRLAWCPAPSCTHAILMVQPADGAPLTGAARVACACGEVFCFACLRDDHSPATCEQLRLWLIKCKDDSETYNWLQANTRACPACKTSVEKSGGCNHMTCRHASCGHEWCWVCAGPWKEHSGNFYTCNRFKETDDEEVKRKDLSKAALERYLHYYSRYINHHSSLMLEEKTRQAMEDKIAEMQALGSNWLDGQYLKEATESLIACRHALQYTYVYAFYLPADNHKELFQMAQRDLEMTTEDLSAEIEKPVEQIVRLTVLHHQQMSERRLANLFNAVEAHRVAEAQAALEAAHVPGALSRPQSQA